MQARGQVVVDGGQLVGLVAVEGGGFRVGEGDVGRSLGGGAGGGGGGAGGGEGEGEGGGCAFVFGGVGEFLQMVGEGAVGWHVHPGPGLLVVVVVVVVVLLLWRGRRGEFLGVLGSVVEGSLIAIVAKQYFLVFLFFFLRQITRLEQFKSGMKREQAPLEFNQDIKITISTQNQDRK